MSEPKTVQKFQRKAQALFVLSLLSIFMLFFPSGAQASTIARPGNMLGIVGSWSFNIFHGTSVPDYSGRGNTGTLSGSYTTAAGKQGNAFSAGAAGTGKVTIPNSASLNLGTTTSISFWINSSPSANAYASILQKSDFATAGWVVQQNNLTSGLYLRLDTSGGTNQTFPPMTILDGTWHHVVFVINNGSIAQYKDGVLANTGTYIQGTGFANAAQSIFLKNSTFANMLVDDLRIYNRALSATEVQGIYNAGGSNYGVVTLKEAPRSGILGEWLFNEGTGSIVHDTSGNKNNFTIPTGALWTTAKNGSGLKFDAIHNTNLIATGKSQPTSAITVAAWLRVYAHASWYDYINNGWGVSDNNAPWDFYSDSTGKPIFGIWPKVGTETGQFNATGCAGTFSLNKWHLMIGTYDGTATKVYLDNVLCGTSPTTVAHTLYTGGSVIIGESGSPGVQPYDMDGVRIYNRVLSAAEMTQLYNEHQTQLNTSSVNLQTGTSLATGLVGLWTFDGSDIGTSILDRSGNGFNGYLVGSNNATSSSKTIGKLGQGFSFAGLNSGGIDLGNNAALTPANFTIAGWVNIASSTYNYNEIFSSDRDCCSVYNGLGLSIIAGKLSGNIWNSTQYNITSTGSIPTSKWTHVAFTYNGTTKSLYINGVLDKSTAQTVNPGTPASFDTYIGSMGQSSGAVYTLQGKLDDIRLYNRALSASEINQLYMMGK